MKSVGENEANRFCFVLTLWPPQGQGERKQYQMIEVNGAYKYGRMKKKKKVDNAQR